MSYVSIGHTQSSMMHASLIVFYLGRCAFGIDTDMQNDVDNIYLKKSAETFQLDVDKLSIVKLTNLLPFFVNPFRYLYLSQVAVRRALIKLIPSLSSYIEETPGSWLTNRVREVVKLRNKSSTTEIKRVDLLQLMIDASTHDDIKVRLLIIIILICNLFYYYRIILMKN